ncbi:MAG TPA: HAD family hydrolase [Epsilonproteobacteria bacterium]|nr:HAD family hydrolase [Campylobacterota bacterium]
MSIKLIVLDVDGTMTDGRISYTSSGDEIKSFSVKDGLGIDSWIKLGKEVAIITGRVSPIIARRAKELGIGHFYEGIKDKKTVLLNILKELDLSWENVAAIGDDLNDLSMLELAKISFAPSDASLHIISRVSHVLTAKGGSGAVREMIEYLIAHEGLSSEYLAQWE